MKEKMKMKKKGKDPRHHTRSSQKTSQNLRKELDLVKKKIIPKRGQFLIRSDVRDFLAEKLLIPTNEESIGGRGESEEIIRLLFKKGAFDINFERECLAKCYEIFYPDYWKVMLKYLHRFFRIESLTQFADPLYDFSPWDCKKPDDYPTQQEKIKAWGKACKMGKNKLDEEENRALEVFYKECEEEESEIIYDTLSLIGYDYGWTFPDRYFRYVSFFDPDLKEFWKLTGLDVTENLRFFLNRNAFSYYRLIIHGKKYKIPKYSLFGLSSHTDYSEFKSQMIKMKIPKVFFEKIEYLHIKIQLQSIVKTLSKIVRPLFIVAHFLKKEDRVIYDDHLRKVKTYISAMGSGNDEKRKDIAFEVWLKRLRDFLFDAVWQDFLFDHKNYLKKPKSKKGRPLNEFGHLLLYLTVEGLKMLKDKPKESVYLLTGRLLNYLTRESRFKIEKRNDISYSNLGADAVRGIYRSAENKFSKKTCG